MFRFAEPAQLYQAGRWNRAVPVLAPRVKSVVIVTEPATPAQSDKHTHTPNPDRQHHLDALRGLLMVLGIVLHAALIYAVEADWVIGDPRRSRVFDWIYAVIHSFRMQTFFMISGILTVRMLKKGPKAFLQDRLIRLTIPLLTIALVLNSVQTLFAFGAPRFWDEYTGGRWVGHLWFIVDLLCFCIVVAGLAAWRPGCREWTLPLGGGAIIWALPLLTAGTFWVRDSWIGHESYVAGLFTPSDLLTYFPFFLFGFLYRPGTDPAQLRRLAGWSALLLVGCLVNPFPQIDGMDLYRTAGISWSASLLCLYTGSLLLARPRRSVRAISDAAYTVYLVHHLGVIVFGLLLLPLAIAIGVKFAAVVLLTCGSAFAFHFYGVARSRWLSMLVNGNTRSFRVQAVGSGAS